MEIVNPRRKRYFCHELYDLYEKKDELDFGDDSKPKYIVESIRDFLKYDDNVRGLELLDRIEAILQSHVDAVQLAVIFLLTNKKERFKMTKDEKIKQYFGSCPFNTLQQLVNLATRLKMELSDDCLHFVFKNKLKLAADAWRSPEFIFTPPSDESPPVKRHFALDMTEREVGAPKKSEPNSTSFSMLYGGADLIEEKVVRHHLKDYYERFKRELSGFARDEFCESMYAVLKSPRSNDELQNELFEMLGFNVFELISELLDNRASLVRDYHYVEPGGSRS